MPNITSITELESAIQKLEAQQSIEWPILKGELFDTYESLKPINLIKNTITEITNVPNLKGEIMNTTLSLAAGYISKKIITGSTQNPLKQLLGTLLQIGVTSIVSKNVTGIKSAAKNVFNNIFSKKETPT